MDIECNNTNQDEDELYQSEETSSDIMTGKSLLNNPNTRLSFVRKVYSILLTQLFITASMSYVSMNHFAVASFQQENYQTLILAIVLSLAAIIAITCFRKLGRIVPTNYILLLIFTLSESYIVRIYMGGLLTVGVTISLTLYACETKKDITIMGGILFICLCVMSLFCVLLFFYSNYLFELLYCCFSAIIYGFYILYDTQLIMGGHRFELTIDDYIISALMLYVDIIRLFLKLLEILARISKK